MGEPIDILQCPATGRPLEWEGSLRLTVNGGPSYSVRDGILHLLPADFDAGDTNTVGVRDFYEAEGWAQDDTGLFGDTKSFLDTRPVSLAYTNKCIGRLRKYFRHGGKYLLDAGSGPIPHDTLLCYGDRFERRVCLDLSVQALQIAKKTGGSWRLSAG